MCGTGFAELDLGEGQGREVVGADWGQGTAGVPLREQLLREPALWVCSKMVAFNTFQGIISFNKFQLRRWELPSHESCPPFCPPWTSFTDLPQGPSTSSASSSSSSSGLPSGPGGKIPTLLHPARQHPRKGSCHPHSHVTWVPAMPRDNDRLSVLRLVRRCMQMTRL